MAITDINISETLEAGAPSIKYTGNRDPNQEPDMLMASDPSWEAEWEDLYQSYKLKQIELGQEFVDKETFMDQYQNNMASGGRVNFGLGTIFKGIKKAVKSAVKSPIGKAAILGGLGMYGMGAGPFGKLGGSGFLRGMGPALFGVPGRGTSAMPGMGKLFNPATKGILGTLGLTGGGGSMAPTALGYGAGLVGAGVAAAAFEGMEEDEIKALRSNPEALRAHLTQYYSNVNPDLGDEEVSAWVETQMYSTGGRVGLSKGSRTGFAYGPDQTAEAAGIMGKLPVRNNAAGVKELDLRDSGGFIPPVGVKEKADDIPAMLSNNEFVMTADAVRAAGGGSMEKGAQRMYNTMKNLESQVV